MELLLRLSPTTKLKWGFSKNRGIILGVPIIGIIVCLGLYWGPLLFGNYQICRGLVCFFALIPSNFHFSTAHLTICASPQLIMQ